MDIDAVIFDSDGTLVDSETLSAAVIVDMFAEAGIDTTPAEVLNQYRGRQFAAYVAEICATHACLDADRFTASFRERSELRYRESLQPMPGAFDFVSRLPLEKCVASNGPRAKIEACLAATGLLPYFENRIASAYEVGAWKPDPRLILEAVRMTNVAPSRCVLIEDSAPGVEAGLAAGVHVIGYALEPDVQQRFRGRILMARDYAEVAALIQH
ncbi:HAD-IA family hydrolase [Paraburkholderia sp.]|uniref:HAD family hydrolase n=1 Tax=Paraburkholderia sp. TaxID=1926495 RepID=UPI002386046B|nr:HAD-IA family hydrolase [Paraburkholderia sp.]MDE1179233.1 HAD-IA family hydrolase [Paraburkholderia sp.]